MYHGACRVSEEYIRAVHVGALNPTGSRLCRRELRLRRLRLPLLGGGVRRARLDRAAALPDDAAHHGRVAMTQSSHAGLCTLHRGVESLRPPNYGRSKGGSTMSKFARVLAGLLVPAFFVAGVVATPAMAQEKGKDAKAASAKKGEPIQKVFLEND